jgi:hypothetical protein
MPKLACPCGHVHNLSPIPDEGWLTVKDADYEDLLSAHTIQKEISGTALPSNDHPHVKEWDKASDVIQSMTGRLYECPKCGCIMWQKPNYEYYEIYSPYMS